MTHEVGISLVDPGGADKWYYSVTVTSTHANDQALYQQGTGSTSYAPGHSFSVTVSSLGSVITSVDNYGSSWPTTTSYSTPRILPASMLWLKGRRLTFSGGTEASDGSLVEEYAAGSNHLTVTSLTIPANSLIYLEGTLDGETFKGKWDIANSSWYAFASSTGSSTGFSVTTTPTLRTTTLFGFSALYVGHTTPVTFVGNREDADGSYTDIFTDSGTLSSYSLLLEISTTTPGVLTTASVRIDNGVSPVSGSYASGVFSVTGYPISVSEPMDELPRSTPYFFSSGALFWQDGMAYHFYEGTDHWDGSSHTDYYTPVLATLGLVDAPSPIQIIGPDAETPSVTPETTAPRPLVSPPTLWVNAELFTLIGIFTDEDGAHRDYYSNSTYSSAVCLKATPGDAATTVLTSGTVGAATGTYAYGVFSVVGKSINPRNAGSSSFTPVLGPPAVTVNGTLWEYRGTWADGDFYAAVGQTAGLWIGSDGSTSGIDPVTSVSLAGGSLLHGVFSGLTPVVLGVKADGGAQTPRQVPTGQSLYVNNAGEPWIYTGSSAANDYYVSSNGTDWLSINGSGGVVLSVGGVTSEGQYANGHFSNVPVSARLLMENDTSTFPGNVDIVGNTLSLGSWADNTGVAGLTINYAEGIAADTPFSIASFTASRTQAQWLWSRSDETGELTLPIMKLDLDGTLNLYDPAGTDPAASPTVKIDPSPAGVSQLPVLKLTNQTAADGSSVMTRSLADARYLQIVANQPVVVNNGVTVNTSTINTNTVAANGAGIGQGLSVGAGQVVVGQYNTVGSGNLFVVGAGSADGARKDALAVTATGDTEASGDFLLTGDLQIGGGMVAFGAFNLLPNQEFGDSAGILTKTLADSHYLSVDGATLKAGADASAGANGIAFGLGATAAANGISVGAQAGTNDWDPAAGVDAVSVGREARGSGAAAVAVGASSVAEGANSVALGAGALSQKASAIAIGQGTVSNQVGQVVVGSYNIQTTAPAANETAATDAVLIVGSGTDDTHRGNAAVIQRNGTVTAKKVRVQAGGDLPMDATFQDSGGLGVPGN